MRTRRFEIPGGERAVVVDRHGGSVPREYVITVETTDGAAVSGTVEVQGSRWLFRKQPEIVPLAREVHACKGFWDTLFRVTIAPDRDVVVTVR